MQVHLTPSIGSTWVLREPFPVSSCSPGIYPVGVFSSLQLFMNTFEFRTYEFNMSYFKPSNPQEINYKAKFQFLQPISLPTRARLGLAVRLLVEQKYWTRIGVWQSTPVIQATHEAGGPQVQSLFELPTAWGQPRELSETFKIINGWLFWNNNKWGWECCFVVGCWSIIPKPLGLTRNIRICCGHWIS